jgi:hypothetical protein
MACPEHKRFRGKIGCTIWFGMIREEVAELVRIQRNDGCWEV